MSDRPGWRLNENELRVWLDALTGDGSLLVAPVEEERLRVYKPVTEVADVCLAPGKTRWSPKEYLFPRSEPLYTYSLSGADVSVEDPPEDDHRLVLFGLRPCDAAAIARLDAVFLGGEVDPFYARRRAATTIISLACPDSDPECFCTAVGGSPASEVGCDLMVIDLQGTFLLFTVTDRGNDLLGTPDPDWTAARESDWIGAQQLIESVEASIAAQPFEPAWSTALEQMFEDDVWQRYGELCLRCSMCSSVCPTCSCFNMSHDGSAWGGTQVRTWDACTFRRFTIHASGHDPRSDQGARYRQRLLHKFAYGRDTEDHTFRCVGCGRCTALCPAGLDIQRAVREIIEKKDSGMTHVSG